MVQNRKECTAPCGPTSSPSQGVPVFITIHLWILTRSDSIIALINVLYTIIRSFPYDQFARYFGASLDDAKDYVQTAYEEYYTRGYNGVSQCLYRIALINVERATEMETRC